MAWMLYLVATSALLALAARLLERVLTMYGRPARFVWLAALAGALMVPLAARRAPPAAEAPVTMSVSVATATAHVEPSVLDRLRPSAEVERLLARAWVASTGLALLFLAGWFASLAVAAGRWPKRRVDEHDVRISTTAGPAVFGVLFPSIVVPGWLLECSPETRWLALQHEREHVAARDPALLAGGAVLVALTPWNPVAWWLLLRLRAAVELDCDRRVLRHGASVRAYGSMLLGIAGRGSAPLATVALVEPTVLLERRIVAMTRKPIRRRALRAIALAAITGVAVVAACQMEAPTEPLVETELPAGALTEMTKPELEGYIVRVNRLVAALREHYEGADPSQIVELRVDDTAGQIEKLETEVARLTRRAAPDTIHAVEIYERQMQPLRRDDGAPGGTFRYRSPGAQQEEAAVGGIMKRRSMDGSASSKPIFMVDGERASEAVLKEISPDRIDRIEVMKGGAAERLIGEKAAGGVISVFLKKDSSK